MGNSSHGYRTLIAEYIKLYSFFQELKLEDKNNNIKYKDHIWLISYGEGTLVILSYHKIAKIKYMSLFQE